MRRIAYLLCLALALFHAPAFAANYSVFCDQSPSLSAEQKNRLLLFADAIKGVLDQSGHPVALVARAGLNLDRFDLRYSHAGISLQQSGNTPWSVRQLYYSCADGRPELYDQGLTGFLIDQDNTRTPYISLVFLSGEEEQSLERAALDKTVALKLLAPNYSANAYAFSTAYQNCNQWVAEMLAHAWGHLPDSGDERAYAQQWLMARRYRPTRVEVRNPFILLGGLVMPLLHTSDHPEQNRRQGVFEVSMPASLEAFVQDQASGASRIEMCLHGDQIVLHHGWSLIAPGCSAGPGDTLMPLS